MHYRLRLRLSTIMRLRISFSRMVMLLVLARPRWSADYLPMLWLANRQPRMAAVSGKLLLFGGSSEWDAQLGGASVFHNDTFCIDLTEAIGTAQRVGEEQAAANAEAQQAPKRGEAPVTLEPAEAQLAPKPAEAVRIVETSLDLANENEDGNGGDAAVAKRIKLQGEPDALPTSV